MLALSKDTIDDELLSGKILDFLSLVLRGKAFRFGGVGTILKGEVIRIFEGLILVWSWNCLANPSSISSSTYKTSAGPSISLGYASNWWTWRSFSWFWLLVSVSFPVPLMCSFFGLFFWRAASTCVFLIFIILKNLKIANFLYLFLLSLKTKIEFKFIQKWNQKPENRPPPLSTPLEHP